MQCCCIECTHKLFHTPNFIFSQNPKVPFTKYTRTCTYTCPNTGMQRMQSVATAKWNTSQQAKAFQRQMNAKRNMPRNETAPHARKFVQAMKHTMNWLSEMIWNEIECGSVLVCTKAWLTQLSGAVTIGQTHTHAHTFIGRQSFTDTQPYPTKLASSCWQAGCCTIKTKQNKVEQRDREIPSKKENKFTFISESITDNLSTQPSLSGEKRTSKSSLLHHLFKEKFQSCISLTRFVREIKSCLKVVGVSSAIPLSNSML